ncbi:MAG: hypothetical protein JWN89_574 [Parcubacteria group bacterium]|nr:hypothetical protein [Parcubacteria group bacterium]
MKEVHVARCVLLSKNRQKLLLLRRTEENATGQGLWECPGGKSVEKNLLHDTLIMEIPEETDLEFVTVTDRFVEVDRHAVTEGKYAGTTFITYFTTAHDASSDPVKLSDEHDACIWATLEEALLDYDLTPQTRRGLLALASAIRTPK